MQRHVASGEGMLEAHRLSSGASGQAGKRAGKLRAIFRLAALKQADDSTDFWRSGHCGVDLVRQGSLLQGMLLAMMGLFEKNHGVFGRERDHPCLTILLVIRLDVCQACLVRDTLSPISLAG